MALPRQGHKKLDHDPLYLIQAHIIAAPIVELGGARRRMIGHVRRLFQRPAVLQVSGDAGGTERVIAHSSIDAGSKRPTLPHGIGENFAPRTS